MSRSRSLLTKRRKPDSVSSQESSNSEGGKSTSDNQKKRAKTTSDPPIIDSNTRPLSQRMRVAVSAVLCYSVVRYLCGLYLLWIVTLTQMAWGNLKRGKMF